MYLSFKQYKPIEDPRSPACPDKQTLLILHGLFGSKRNWQQIARQLSEQFEVFTLDLRNHGESGHSDSMNYQNMTDDIFQLIKDQSLKEVSIIGHSMGGKVAMQTALQYPNLIKRLVIIDIAPVQYQHGFEDLITSLKALPMDQVSSRQDADKLLQTSIQSESLRQFLLQNLHKVDADFSWRINLEAIESCLDDLMDFPDNQKNTQFQNPVLFFKGEKSDYIKYKDERKIFKIFPRALFITVANTGHWLHAENPDFVIREIRKFIK